MKKRVVLLFLAILSVASLCVSFSACDFLSDYLNSVQSTEQTSSGSDSTEESSSDDSSEQDSSSSDSTGQDSSGDSTGQDSSGSDSTGQDSSSSDSTGQDSSGGDSTGQDSSSGDSTGQDSSSGDSTGQDSSGGDSTGQDSSGGDSTGQDSSSGDSTGQDSSSGDTPSQDTDTDPEEDDGDDGDDDGDDDDDTGTETEDGGETPAEITARAGNSTYGYEQLAGETNGEAMQTLYYQMYVACEAFTTNTSDVTKTGGYYAISTIYYGSYSLTTSEALSVWRVFYFENPMYYWLANSCVYTNSILYLCIDEAYVSYTDRAAYDKAISSMMEEVSALAAKQSTELEKAMAIHDYIISAIDYAYQSDNVTPETAIWAHNITGVSSMGGGVCEAYAKTYLAMCLANGLDCVIVTGYATASGGAHAWNLVKIDGVWYGVDCTWDDTGDDDDLSYNYFGMSASEISSTRTTDSSTYGLDYLYGLPEIATRSIQLVTLFKGTTNLGVYLNIDDAFAAMTDSSADYTIELYFYNYAGTLVYTSPATTMYVYSTSTPAVNSITINGIYTDLGNGYFYVSYLNLASSLTLRCNLEISNIILTAAKLDLGEYTLTTSGYYCQLNGTISDSKTTGTISIQSTTSSPTVINATLDISYYYGSASISGTANIGTYYGSDMLVVYGTVTIDTYISANETNYYNVYLQGGAALSVNTLTYADKNQAIYVLVQFDSLEDYPALYLGDVNTQTYLVISGSVSTGEEATPSNLDCAIAALGDADDFAKIQIYFGNVSKTSSYNVNTDNEIVYKQA